MSRLSYVDMLNIDMHAASFKHLFLCGYVAMYVCVYVCMYFGISLGPNP